MKGLDFFPKVSMNDISKQTCIGSTLSIIAISLMLYLLFRDLIDFYSPHIKTDSIVQQDEHEHDKIKINLDLYFNRAPCHLLSLDQEDSLRNHKLDISDTIEKISVPNTKTKNPFSKRDAYNLDNLFNAVTNTHGCELKGYLEIAKVPGNFHISFHNYRSQWAALRQQKPNLIPNVRLSHIFNTFYFGDIDEKTLLKYGITPRGHYNEKKFNDLPNFLSNQESKNYDYFIKIIPYELVDENRGTKMQTYQFSISYKESNFILNQDDMPMILVKYEFSPITMRVTLQGRDYLHFLTHICAIIGGVFVVFSILNSILTSIFDFESSD